MGQNRQGRQHRRSAVNQASPAAVSRAGPAAVSRAGAAVASRAVGSTEYDAKIRNAIRYERIVAVKALIPLALVAALIAVYLVYH
jgi:hypothetical protein